MTAINIYKTRKDELVEKTINLLPIALSGDCANRTFFFIIDENGELQVDYIDYLGQQSLSDNCFFTIKAHETPDPKMFGYDNFDEMDFSLCGFDEEIEIAIDEKMMWLEKDL
jgi:hypothetical protein